nr:putative replicase protein [Red clover enamovirus 1]
MKHATVLGLLPTLLLAITCSFLLPSAGQFLGHSGTDPAVGCSPFQGGISSSADLPQSCAVFGSMQPDLDWSYLRTVQEREEQQQSPSNHTGPFLTISTWIWPNWTCSPSQCQLQMYFPTWQVIRQDILHLLKDWDLLTIYQRCSGLLTRTPGYILRFAGETLIWVATLIEFVLVSWNLWLYSLLLYVVEHMPGKSLLWLVAGLIISWVWPKKTASYLVQLTTLPVTSIRFWSKTGTALISHCTNAIWNILTTWSLLPWVILTKMTRFLVSLTGIFSRRERGMKKKASSKSLLAKMKAAKREQKRKDGLPKKKSHSVEERAIPGVQIKKLREDPPRGVILRCTDQFGDHVGYATAVKLDGGAPGILLPLHVWEDTVNVTGPNGSVKMGTFHCVYECTPHDSIILTSPMGDWTSKIGARPKTLTTIEAAKLKNYSLFTERDGKWYVQAAKLIAPAEGMFRVVSETAPGDSGLPLFDMKMNVVAVHRGGWPTEKFPENRAFAILPVPGLTAPTSPKYISCDETYCENETAYEMAEDYSDGEEVIVRTKGKSYKTFIGLNRVATLSETALREELSRGPIGVWADIEDDESVPKRSGNGKHRSTPVKQSQAKSLPKVDESADSNPEEKKAQFKALEKELLERRKPAVQPPTPAHSEERRAKLRRSEMTPEQKKADNLRRRQAAKRRTSAATPPRTQAKAPTLSQVAELVEKAVKAALTVRPRRSRVSSRVSTGGGSPGRKPQASRRSELAPSPSTSVLRKDSQNGGSVSLKPQRSYWPAQRNTAGQKQEPRQN